MTETLMLYAGMALYIVTTLLAVRHFASGASSTWAGRACVLGAVLAHAGAMLVRGGRTHGFPAQNLQEFAMLTLTVMMGAVLLLDIVKRLPALLYGAAPVAAIGIPLAGLISRTSSGPFPPPAVGPWTALHVIAVTAGYACFLIAFIAGIMFMAARRELRDRTEHSMISGLPPLETALRINRVAVLVGFLLLTAGILLGYFYARSAPPGEGWRVDPKVIFSTVTWACYGAVLILAVRPSWRGRRAVIASMVSFASVVFTMWASYLSDFHRYS